MSNEQHEQPTAEVHGGEAGNQRPVKKFSGTGGVAVAVWKTKNDEGRDWYSVRIDRSFKGDDDKFHSTPYLRDSDLLRVQQLLGQADQWIEQDKANGRLPSTAANGR